MTLTSNARNARTVVLKDSGTPLTANSLSWITSSGPGRELVRGIDVSKEECIILHLPFAD